MPAIHQAVASLARKGLGDHPPHPGPQALRPPHRTRRCAAMRPWRLGGGQQRSTRLPSPTHLWNLTDVASPLLPLGPGIPRPRWSGIGYWPDRMARSRAVTHWPSPFAHSASRVAHERHTVRHAPTPGGTSALARLASASTAAINPTVRRVSSARRTRCSSARLRLCQITRPAPSHPRAAAARPMRAGGRRRGSRSTTGPGGGDWGVWLGGARRPACSTPSVNPRQPAPTLEMGPRNPRRPA